MKLKCHEVCALPTGVGAIPTVNRGVLLRKRDISDGITTSVIVSKTQRDGVNVPTDATACDTMVDVVDVVRKEKRVGSGSGGTTYCRFAPNVDYVSAVRKA